MSVALLRKPKQIKQDGATFTPPALAEHLAAQLVRHAPDTRPLRVLDPACGDGALLLAIGRELEKAGLPYSLHGFDINQPYLELARQRLDGLNAGAVRLECRDFLEFCAPHSFEPSLFADIAEQQERYDLVIANPPYVRTQHLGAERAQALSAKFGLKGRVDLYYPFVIAMTHALNAGGILGLITSNRFLSIRSGGPVRRFLGMHYEVKHLIDLGDTKLFDASVLPAVLVAKRSMPNERTGGMAAFTRVYESADAPGKGAHVFSGVMDALRDGHAKQFVVGGQHYTMATGRLAIDGTDKPWGLLADDEESWVHKVNAAANFRLGERFKVRVGIKTTADKVFIRDDWNTMNGTAPEPELLKELISQENIGAWRMRQAGTLKVLYTHEIRNGRRRPIELSRWPKAEAYLLDNAEVLKARKYVADAGRAWYEIWVPQDPAAWSRPKLVFPDISEGPRFYHDTSGRLVNGNCYWIPAMTPELEPLLLLAQAVCNSRLMRKYHDLVFQNKLYAGRRRYFSQFIEQYPMPDPGSAAAQKIIGLVGAIHAAPSEQHAAHLVARVDDLVEEAFGMR